MHVLLWGNGCERKQSTKLRRKSFEVLVEKKIKQKKKQHSWWSFQSSELDVYRNSKLFEVMHPSILKSILSGFEKKKDRNFYCLLGWSRKPLKKHFCSKDSKPKSFSLQSFRALGHVQPDMCHFSQKSSLPPRELLSAQTCLTPAHEFVFEPLLLKQSDLLVPATGTNVLGTNTFSASNCSS